MGKNSSYATSMDEFHINFNIFGKYGDFESWQKAELSSKVKKRRRGKQRRGRSETALVWRTISLLKNTVNA